MPVYHVLVIAFMKVAIYKQFKISENIVIVFNRTDNVLKVISKVHLLFFGNVNYL